MLHVTLIWAVGHMWHVSILFILRLAAILQAKILCLVKVFTRIDSRDCLHERHLCILCCNSCLHLVLGRSICGFSPSSWAWIPIMVWQGLPWTTWGWNRSVKPSYRSLVQVAWMVFWIFLSIALENWIHWMFCFLVSLPKIEDSL